MKFLSLALSTYPTKPMEITPPKFELHERVTLGWNEKKIFAIVTYRRYYPGKDYWEYGIALQRFPSLDPSEPCKHIVVDRI